MFEIVFFFPEFLQRSFPDSDGLKEKILAEKKEKEELKALLPTSELPEAEFLALLGGCNGTLECKWIQLKQFTIVTRSYIKNAGFLKKGLPL